MNDIGQLRRLQVLLASTTLFHGVDLTILALLLPQIADTFGASAAVLGLTRIPIELGRAAGFFVARLADRVGRRPIMIVAVLGYTIATSLTALSWNLAAFVAFQFLARVFLATELIVAITMVVEEFPVARRGPALGSVFAFDALGTIAVALLLAAGLADGPLGWRLFFLVGLAPLLLVVFLRRRYLPETALFEQAGAVRGPRLWEVWAGPHRRTLLIVGLVHLLRSIPVFAAGAWWAYYAERERGFSEAVVAGYLLSAYAVGCVGFLVCGGLIARLGTRVTAVVYLLGSAMTCVVLFTTEGAVVQFVALVLAVSLGVGAQPVLAMLAGAPFPTEIRAQAVGWAQTWFELPGFILGPAIVGVLGDARTGLIGSIGSTVALLAVLLLPAAYLVWRYLPDVGQSASGSA